jgi:hypothetical protein
VDQVSDQGEKIIPLSWGGILTLLMNDKFRAGRGQSNWRLGLQECFSEAVKE